MHAFHTWQFVEGLVIFLNKFSWAVFRSLTLQVDFDFDVATEWGEITQITLIELLDYVHHFFLVKQTYSFLGTQVP